jgi:hypothetical protein
MGTAAGTEHRRAPNETSEKKKESGAPRADRLDLTGGLAAGKLTGKDRNDDRI